MNTPMPGSRHPTVKTPIGRQPRIIQTPTVGRYSIVTPREIVFKLRKKVAR